MRHMCHWVSSSGWPVLPRGSIRRCTFSLMESLSRWCSTSLRLSSMHYSSVYHWAQRRDDYPTTPPMTFVHNDALPLGSFCKYTWHITNLMHVKRIFDTPELPLELTQSFAKNSDGCYSPYRCQETPPDLGSDTYHHSHTNKPLAIRPLELRTFLRVGTCAAEQTEPVPFVTE